MRVADTCVQVMGGSGGAGTSVVEQIFREVRAFRIYDGPSEVHKWSLARRIKRAWREAIPDWDFYMTFQLFRLAAIFHGLKGRGAVRHRGERPGALPRRGLPAPCSPGVCGDGAHLTRRREHRAMHRR